MRPENQKVLSAGEAKTMPSTRARRTRQCLGRETRAVQLFLELRKFYAVTSRKTKSKSSRRRYTNWLRNFPIRCDLGGAATLATENKKVTSSNLQRVSIAKNSKWSG